MVEIIFWRYVPNDYHQIVLMMYNVEIKECLILINEIFFSKTWCFSTEQRWAQACSGTIFFNDVNNYINGNLCKNCTWVDLRSKLPQAIFKEKRLYIYSFTDCKISSY